MLYVLLSFCKCNVAFATYLCHLSVLGIFGAFAISNALSRFLGSYFLLSCLKLICKSLTPLLFLKNFSYIVGLSTHEMFFYIFSCLSHL